MILGLAQNKVAGPTFNLGDLIPNVVRIPKGVGLYQTEKHIEKRPEKEWDKQACRLLTYRCPIPWHFLIDSHRHQKQREHKEHLRAGEFPQGAQENRD
jgi:hypothetical protein